MIIRDVAVSMVDDLVVSPPRVALAATVDGQITVYPVRATLAGPAGLAATRIVQVPQGTPDLCGRKVVVVADDGPQWFRLRSLTFRGVARAVGDQSYQVTPTRMMAWDYGALRESSTPAAAPTPSPLFEPAAVEINVGRPLYSPNLEAAARKSRVMILASRSAAGTPFAVPLWFVAHRGRIYATSSATSWTVRNVVACPQIALLFGGERKDADAQRLLVRGYAAAVPGMPPPAVMARIAARYYLPPAFAAVELRHIPQWARRMRYYGQSQPAYLLVTPQTATACQAP
jgi:hypothetical protein